MASSVLLAKEEAPGLGVSPGPLGGERFDDHVLAAVELSRSETGAKAIRFIYFIHLGGLILRIFDLGHEHYPSVRHVQEHIALGTGRKSIGSLKALC